HHHALVSDMLARIPGRRKDVQDHVRKSIQIAARLAAVDPEDKTAQSELGQYLSDGGETLLDPGDWQESVSYLRRALPIFQKLLKDEPGNGLFQLYAALTEAELGAHLATKGATPDSIQWIRRGYADMARLVERDPSNPTQFLELLKVQRMLIRAL